MKEVAPILHQMFDKRRQDAFARLSGDWNPLHMDAVAARRLLYGRPAVHGIHLLLWALEERARAGKFGALARLSATFYQPVFVGQTVDYAMQYSNAHRGYIRGEDGVAVDFKFDLENAPEAFVTVPDQLPLRSVCVPLTFAEAAKASGHLALALPQKDCADLFPHLTRVLPPAQIATLLATTRLVGMQCPGEHSLYADLELMFSNYDTEESGLRYKVQSADERVSRLVISIHGPGFAGTVKSFYRPPPVHQTKAAQLAGRVFPGEFSAGKVLVVGGSRGLGEAAAKIFGYGGADVCLTYASGKADAEQVVTEICAVNGQAKALELDVTRGESEIRQALVEVGQLNRLIYCASPRIVKSQSDRFRPTYFRSMCQVYVEGFWHVVQAIRRPGRQLKVFYPSTVFLDEKNPDYREYVAAKAAGEAVGQLMSIRFPEVDIYSPRLPKISSDQTAALVYGSAHDAVEVLLPLLRAWA